MKRFTIAEASNTVAAQIGKQIQGCETLDDVCESLKFENSPFARHFIYRGGNHVAIHESVLTERLALIY